MAKPSGEPGFPHWEDADYVRRMRQHDHLFALLAIPAGLIFLQGYMIAPLIPRLAEIFNVSPQEIGFIVPAYMLSYAVAALFYGILSDRFGRWLGGGRNFRTRGRLAIFVFGHCDGSGPGAVATAAL